MRACILISGTGSTMQAILEAMEAGELDLDITAVLSDKDATGLEIATAHDIPTIVVSPKEYDSRAEWDAALLHRVQATGAEFVILAGFMKILSADFVTSIATLNTHPALLPSFPGAHGVRDALDYGVKISGATAHWVDAGVDTGPIVAQTAVPVEPHDTEDTLRARIQAKERIMYVDVLNKISRGEITLGEKSC